MLVTAGDEFEKNVGKTIESGENDGVKLNSRLTGAFIESVGLEMEQAASNSSDLLKKANLSLASDVIKNIGESVKNKEVNVRMSRDGTVDYPRNKQGEHYARKLTNRFSLIPKGKMEYNISEGLRFEGKMLIQYTQQKKL